MKVEVQSHKKFVRLVWSSAKSEGPVEVSMGHFLSAIMNLNGRSFRVVKRYVGIGKDGGFWESDEQAGPFEPCEELGK